VRFFTESLLLHSLNVSQNGSSFYNNSSTVSFKLLVFTLISVLFILINILLAEESYRVHLHPRVAFFGTVPV